MLIRLPFVDYAGADMIVAGTVHLRAAVPGAACSLLALATSSCRNLPEPDPANSITTDWVSTNGPVTQLFAGAGRDLVVVSGSAVEFYTEGAYMSGNIDFRRRQLKPVPLRKAQDLMARRGGGPRNWRVSGLHEEWQQSREARRRAARLVEPPVVRRKESWSDSRLRRAFDGERGPAFPDRM